LPIEDVLAEIDGLELASLEDMQDTVRIEARFNANTGNLRGIAFRERNKERKVVYYVGARSQGDRRTEFESYANTYWEVKRGSANGLANGGHPKNPVYQRKEIGKGSVGTSPDW
jgi:hypothetical protein